MNIANKLTIARVLMIPVFLIFLLTDWFTQPMTQYIALAVFIIASFTDFLDGYIARSRNLITNLGKFLDPLADKMLVTSAMVGLVQLDRLSAWVVILIISREFIVTGFRILAASEGIVIAASYWGKIKTVSQMFMVIVLLLPFTSPLLQWIEWILIWTSVISTIISGLDYIIKNKQVLVE
ncbi:MAG: CDP-diacylglycerol--glycerol-3-phosphate 3-phosphatidyltransferase [Epulopiscium sp.]|nr:CDP-diacylglycerol--glycerol-3-phosphate 3-phosphatidyltransferase [Candidatus Epulonipiscium sp.]